MVQFFSPQTVYPAKEVKVLTNREVLIKGDLLGNESDEPSDLGRVSEGIDSANRNAAAGRLEQGVHNREGRGLPGPVGSKQTENFPFFD